MLQALAALWAVVQIAATVAAAAVFGKYYDGGHSPLVAASAVYFALYALFAMAATGAAARQDSMGRLLKGASLVALFLAVALVTTTPGVPKIIRLR